MKRIAIIFDNRARPETTGLYCRRALGEMVQAGQLIEVEHFLPDECAEIPPDRFDLFLFIDDGLQRHIPEHLKPAVWWAIDTHLDYERALSMARGADWSFAAQRPGAMRLQADGITNATWLPLACDPAIHGKQPTQMKYDWAFVGHVFPGERERLLSLIQQRYPNCFIGNKYLEEMAQTYSASRIVFNRSLEDDINMRVFEGLCSGSLLLTNNLPEAGQDELFQEGVHYAGYTQDEQLLDKLEYYLNHEQQRSQIAEQGRQEVLRAHTYRHRMETILATVTAQQAFDFQSQGKSSRAAIEAKQANYFEHSRPDVLELIPKSAKRILEIGCGSGMLGASIKQRQSAYVAGIEFDPVAAQLASQRLDEVFVRDVEAEEFEFPMDSFECIICADVLEHLRDPESVLKLVRGWLKPDGCLVTSLPNVRNHTVIQSLLAGNWTYESAGLLDNDHVRFFTRREIEKLLFRTGFSVEEMKMIGGDGYAEWVQSGSPQELSIAGMHIKASSQEEAAEFFAYQYLTRSKVSPVPEYGKTSIIIVTYNQLEYTRQCVESILLRTDEPIELIFVDNASTDLTTQYLHSLSNATVICNETNRGFPAAVNQGIEVATGENILLLNNDTIVTTGWLQRMLSALHSSEQVGLVGPVSNNISGPQQVATSYQHLNELDGFAWDWGKQHHSQRVDADRLVGFCLLFKREVVNRIGLLDERFGIGNFEDDDFCRRATEAGYQTQIAVDSFVHHFGSVSFQGARVDLKQVLQENQKLYQEKWNDTDLSAQPKQESFSLGKKRPGFTLESTADGLKLHPNTIRLSACLIVRNNENTIRPCLESIKPWVDEIVVVDTGSTDATPQICKELGARVFHWPWRDDFAAARNESIDHARGEWIFWMDSDDTIPEHCGKQLRELADGDHAENVLGYVAQVHCPGVDSMDVTAVDHVKLFRNRPDLRFEFRIHEQVIPSIRRAGGEVAWTDLYVVHSGSDQTVEGRAGKLVRDFRLLEKELTDRPDHPFVLFNLGMTHADAKQYEQATEYLFRCIEVTGPEESHLCKAYALLVNALSQSNRHEQAWEVVNEGLKLFADDKELMFRLALLQHHFGNLSDAEQTYLRILSEETDRKFASVDQGISNFKARHNLAVVYEDAARTTDAEQQWRTITEQFPEYLPAWRGLGENLLSQNKEQELMQLLDANPNQSYLQATAQYFRGKIARESDDHNQAKMHFEAGLELDPRDASLLNELCRWHFEMGDPVDSQAHLEQLISINPEDPSAHTNMGIVLMSQQKYEAAANAFQTTLKHNPHHPTAIQHLTHCRDNAS